MKKNLFFWMPEEKLDEMQDFEFQLKPKINLYEQEENLILEVELPGVKTEDINLQINKETVKIEAEKKSETEVKEKNYYLKEMKIGKFSRILSLPKSIDSEQVSAKFKNGKLVVVLPKLESEENMIEITPEVE